MAKGFMRISREIENWGWYRDSNTFRVFFHLMLKAQYQDGNECMGVQLERGQVIMGRNKLSADLGISEQSVRTSLKRLSKSQEITIKTTNKYSVITLCKYDYWQDSELSTNQQNNQQLTNENTENQPTTNHIQEIINNKEKEIKRLKEELAIASKKKESRSFVIPSVDEVDAYVKEQGYHFDAAAFVNFYESKGWLVGKSKMKDWKAACRTWEGKRKEENPSLFSQKTESNPWKPNLEKYEPADLTFSERFQAYIIPNKFPICNHDWPYTSENRPDGARVCNGSDVWVWNAEQKIWREER